MWNDRGNNKANMNGNSTWQQGTQQYQVKVKDGSGAVSYRKYL